MGEEKKDPADAQMEALLASLGGDADKLLAELLGGDPAPADQYATKPREIKARLKEIVAKNPQLVAKIIEYWMKEGKRWK